MVTRHRSTSGVPNVPGRIGGADWDDTHTSTALHGTGSPINGAAMTFGFFVDAPPYLADGGTFRLVIEGVPTAYFDINATIEDVIAALEAHPSVGVGNVVGAPAGVTLATVGEMDFELAGSLVRTNLDIDIETTITPSLAPYINPSTGTLGETGEYYIDDGNSNVWRNLGTYLDANWWPESDSLQGAGGRRLNEQRSDGSAWSIEQFSPVVGHYETYRLSLERFGGARVTLESSDGLTRHLRLTHDAAVLEAEAVSGSAVVYLTETAAVISVSDDVGGLTRVTLTADGVSITGLPTADPHVADRLWNSGGTLKISAG